MQGQKDSFEPVVPESLQFDCGSNSSSPDMGQPNYQSNLLLNPVVTPTLADFLLSPNGPNVDYMTNTSQATDDLCDWSLQDPNANPFVGNQENDGDTKISDGWNTALSMSSGGSPRIEERCCERTDLSFESVGLNLDLNNTLANEGQTSTHSLNLTNMSESADYNMHAAPHANNVEISMCPFIPEFFESEHFPCSNSNGSSSRRVGHISENDGRERNSGLVLACKRKNLGVIGESSTTHISADLNIPSSSMYLTPTSSLEENQSPSSHMHRVSSEGYPPSSLIRSAETSQRNLRARLDLLHQNDVSSSQSHFVVNNSRLPSDHSPGEPSSVLNNFVYSADQSHPHILPCSVLPHTHHSPSTSRVDVSSVPAFLQQRMGLIASHEESNIRSLPTDGVIDHPTFLASSVNHLVQDPANWNPSNSSLSLLGNRVGSNSGIIPLSVSMMEPSEVVPVQYPRNLAEAVRGYLFPSGGSESGYQSATLPSRHSSHSASTQEPGQSSRAVLQSYSQPYLRTAVSSERQHGLSALSLSSRGRDRRSRMISEQIRNALDLMRRGGPLRVEDIFFFDRLGFYGRHDFLDRHRDLRLDVDNMSYEELLALEERIGYVNTGLCEHTILKCLKKQIYSRCNLDVAVGEQEPCCICQEDYSEGDDIGSLDCRHDFHTACIKQWLMIKNLCPICKTTALVEGHSTMSDETK